MTDIKSYSNSYHQFLLLLADKNIAKAQEAYMRNQFPFIGLKKPALEAAIKDFQLKNGHFKQFPVLKLAECLTAFPEREMWYTALSLLKKSKEKLTMSDLPYLESLIEKGAWWDIVDVVAPHFIGSLAKSFPSEMKSVIEAYRLHPNFWFRRTSIIYQLSYKSTTDAPFLFSTCQMMATEKEFFIRKAIGWALREYSKTNPKAVSLFLKENETILSYLSIKEGSKYL